MVNDIKVFNPTGIYYSREVIKKLESIGIYISEMLPRNDFTMEFNFAENTIARRLREFLVK